MYIGTIYIVLLQGRTVLNLPSMLGSGILNVNVNVFNCRFSLKVTVQCL